LIVAGPVSAILVLVFFLPPVQTFLSRVRPSGPTIVEAPGPTPAPPVSATPSPKGEVRALPRAAVRPQSAEERPREASTATRGASSPSALDPPVPETPSRAASPPVAGLPHADVTRNMSEGGGEAYVVRLSDPAGRPATGARVSLLVRMASGTLLDIPLGSGPEPGTYHATVPPLDQPPVDLRIRVVTDERRLEIPLTP